jgi:protein-disulfide isomerase
MNQKSLFVTFAGLLVLGFVAASLLYKNSRPVGQDGASDQNTSVVERPGAPVKGAVDARVTIVEFLDPACGTCAQFFPLTNQLVQQSEGKVKVMVRYAPLHAGSDQVVKMLEAAHLQGKFWQALELLFRNQDRWVINHQAQPQRARAILNSITMDHAKLDLDINSTEVSRAVEQDVRDGQAMGVRATPEFFVNGKPLPSFGFEQLDQLVTNAVAANY